MTIQNPEAYNRAALWDYAHFHDDCFEGKIDMSDIDGAVERRGYFLVIETKAPGVKIDKATEIWLDALVEIYGFFTIRIWGEPNRPTRTVLSYRKGRKVIVEENNNATMDSLKELIRLWFVWVEKQPRKRPA